MRNLKSLVLAGLLGLTAAQGDGGFGMYTNDVNYIYQGNFTGYTYWGISLGPDVQTVNIDGNVDLSWYFAISANVPNPKLDVNFHGGHMNLRGSFAVNNTASPSKLTIIATGEEITVTRDGLYARAYPQTGSTAFYDFPNMTISDNLFQDMEYVTFSERSNVYAYNIEMINSNVYIEGSLTRIEPVEYHFVSLPSLQDSLLWLNGPVNVAAPFTTDQFVFKQPTSKNNVLVFNDAVQTSGLHHQIQGYDTVNNSYIAVTNDIQSVRFLVNGDQHVIQPLNIANLGTLEITTANKVLYFDILSTNPVGTIYSADNFVQEDIQVDRNGTMTTVHAVKFKASEVSSFSLPSPTTVTVTKESTTETDLISYFTVTDRFGGLHTGTTTYILSASESSSQPESSSSSAHSSSTSEPVSSSSSVHSSSASAHSSSASKPESSSSSAHSSSASKPESSSSSAHSSSASAHSSSTSKPESSPSSAHSSSTSEPQPSSVEEDATSVFTSDGTVITQVVSHTTYTASNGQLTTDAVTYLTYDQVDANPLFRSMASSTTASHSQETSSVYSNETYSEPSMSTVVVTVDGEPVTEIITYCPDVDSNGKTRTSTITLTCHSETCVPAKETGSSNAGSSNAGSSNAGSSNAESSHAGSSNSGTSNSGSSNAGSSGSSNAGSSGSGSSSSGSNSGSGSSNTGSSNTGSSNAGSSGSGSSSSGSNSGSGSSNTGSSSSGSTGSGSSSSGNQNPNVQIQQSVGSSGASGIRSGSVSASSHPTVSNIQYHGTASSVLNNVWVAIAMLFLSLV